MAFIMAMIGLASGNFIHARFWGHRDWDEAVKISFFQVSAVGVAWILQAIQQHFG